jgi:hypothetical protein
MTIRVSSGQRIAEANLQSGRFGAGAEVGARIRDFLIKGALTVGGPP